MLTKQKWQTAELSEVCKIEKKRNTTSGLTYVGLEDIESNSGTFIGSMESRSVKSATFYFTSEHLLYGRLRPYLNKVLLPRFEGHCSTEIFPIKVGPELYKKYFFYWLTSDDTVSRINKTCTGARMPRANLNEVLKFEISFPESLEEQKRIVSILDESFAEIDKATKNTEQNLKNVREIFESLLRSIFKNPGTWCDKTLGEVCGLYQGLAINKKTKHLLVEHSDLPLLRIKDLKNNTIEQYVDNLNYPPNSLVNPTDLIYSRTGQIGLVFTGRKGVLHNNCFKIVPSSILSREYLFWWLQNPEFKSKIISLSSKTAQPDITHTIFKKQAISIPTLLEQESIISKIKLLDQDIKKIMSLYQQKLIYFGELKKSILNKAFKGEL